MKLKSTDSLQVLLASAAATSQCPLTAGYTDVAEDASTCAPGCSDGQTNGATAVTWVAAPSAGLVREISTLSFRNEDTASVTATVRLNNGTTTRNRRKFVLAPGEGFAYESGSGFTVFAADGMPKVASAVTSVNGGTGPVVLVLPSDIIVALGDETTAITTGTAKVTIRAPRAMTLSKVKGSLTAASTSGLPQFDVKKNGTTIFSTKPTIDVGEKTTETAATAAVLATTAIAADDELTFDIVNAGTGATGAKITLVATSP